MADRIYRISNSRWKTALSEGFELVPEDNAVRTVFEDEDGKPAFYHTIILDPLDCAVNDGKWGRIRFGLQKDEEIAFYVYALALNEEKAKYGMGDKSFFEYMKDPNVDRAEKIRVLRENGAVRSVNQSDVLLYSLEGRYLFLVVDVIGEGSTVVKDMRVYLNGDTFMAVFPEVYRERNGFFHRWMSVYSSIYNDLQEDIEALPKLLDVDTCPAELLPVYASWLGIDIEGGFLPEDVCRNLVKEGYLLLRRKGTRWALQRIIEIVLGCEAEILEHNTMRGYLLSDGAQIPSKLKEGGVLDVTILIHGKIKETMRHQLIFLLDQFKPVRSRLRLIQLDNNAMIDGNFFLDMNATIPEGQAPTLDDELSMGGVLTLN